MTRQEKTNPFQQLKQVCDNTVQAAEAAIDETGEVVEDCLNLLGMVHDELCSQLETSGSPEELPMAMVLYEGVEGDGDVTPRELFQGEEEQEGPAPLKDGDDDDDGEGLVTLLQCIQPELFEEMLQDDVEILSSPDQDSKWLQVHLAQQRDVLRQRHGFKTAKGVVEEGNREPVEKGNPEPVEEAMEEAEEEVEEKGATAPVLKAKSKAAPKGKAAAKAKASPKGKACKTAPKAKAGPKGKAKRQQSKDNSASSKRKRGNGADERGDWLKKKMHSAAWM